MNIRDAIRADLPAILAIYNEVVRNTTAIYEEVESTLAERQAWFDDRLRQGLPILVATSEGQVVGFSSFGEWRNRWGYRFSVEHSVHVHVEFRGRGFGRALTKALFPRAVARGAHVMVAHIDAEAAGSLRLHRSLGFQSVGTFRQVGAKFGRWLDLVAMQRFVETDPGTGREPFEQQLEK